MAVDYTKLADKLGEHFSLIAVPLGLLAFVLGSAGGFKGFGVEIAVPPGLNQWLLQGIGALICIAGFILLRRPTMGHSKALTKDYGIEILAPRRDEAVKLRVRISGSAKEIPPDGIARVVEFVPGNQTYHPKGPLLFDSRTKEWHAEFGVGGKVGDSRVFIVVLAGESSLQLYSYYSQVGKETGKWVGLRQLPPDSKKVAEVAVKLGEQNQ